VGPEPLAVRGGLFVQPAGPLQVPAEDRGGGHDAAAAALAADQAKVGESGQRLAYNAAGDTELFLEFLFGGKGRPGQQGPFHDLPVQDVPDLRMKGRAFLPVQAVGPLPGLCPGWLHTHSDSFAA